MACVAAGAVSAQEPATFRSATRLVMQTVTVTDREGRPIEGLTANDFAITEDGAAQEIAFVEFQRLTTTPGPPVPPEPAAAPAVASAARTQIATPRPGDIQYRNRRLLVLYFDVSAMPPPDQMRAYSNARAFIETQMTPADLVAVMTFQGGAVRVRQDFTGDRALLRETILRLVYGDDLDGDGLPDNPDPGTAFGQDD